jgi:hypothetical protein
MGLVLRRLLLQRHKPPEGLLEHRQCLPQLRERLRLRPGLRHNLPQHQHQKSQLLDNLVLKPMLQLLELLRLELLLRALPLLELLLRRQLDQLLLPLQLNRLL